jgi:hypothetical protein
MLSKLLKGKRLIGHIQENHRCRPHVLAGYPLLIEEGQQLASRWPRSTACRFSTSPGRTPVASRALPSGPISPIRQLRELHGQGYTPESEAELLRKIRIGILEKRKE